jgi:GH15 family glucan-1,4-alpha-glucosidase
VCQLAAGGQVPGGDRARLWRAERDEVARWVEEHCWSESRRSYTQYPGTDALDVACLLMARMGYAEVAGSRFEATLDAIRSELMVGPYAYRYSGMQDREGAFVACSFWLVEAFARAGRLERAAELMERAVGIGNGLGLLSEEVDPSSGELLGNFPQALSHLALINAAATIDKALEGRERPNHGEG